MPMMLLNVAYSVPPKRNSVRASLVMDHFGISADIAERVLARDLEIPLEAGDIVLLTGGSGSGKSSLLRALVAQLNEEASRASPSQPSACTPPALLHLQHLDLGQQILIDALPLEFDESLQLLASCGLGEAQLMLRTPQELSDGQRYRFVLALAIAHRPRWIVADEFAALLDRTTAQVIAHNIRRLADRTGIGFLLATAQNDIHQDLEADIHVTCELDGQIDVHVNRSDTISIPFATSPTPPLRKKKEPPSASTPTSGSAWPPDATGRTSLGGIIAATTSD